MKNIRMIDGFIIKNVSDIVIDGSHAEIWHDGNKVHIEKISEISEIY